MFKISFALLVCSSLVLCFASTSGADGLRVTPTTESGWEASGASHEHPSGARLWIVTRELGSVAEPEGDPQAVVDAWRSEFLGVDPAVREVWRERVEVAGVEVEAVGMKFRGRAGYYAAMTTEDLAKGSGRAQRALAAYFVLCEGADIEEVHQACRDVWSTIEPE